VTTWPAFTEAMHLVTRVGRRTGQGALWRLVHSKRLVLADLSYSALDRYAKLMDQYADTPKDLADATLLSLAEEQKDRRIFTPDSDLSRVSDPGRPALRRDSVALTTLAHRGDFRVIGSRTT
jgi:predicted nucleic acid-binding protein